MNKNQSQDAAKQQGIYFNQYGTEKLCFKYMP